MNPFSLHYWLDGDSFPGIPARPDNYRPGHITWGSNPKRGRAIQRARASKQRAANLAFFLPNVLPLLSPEDARQASLHYGQETGDYEPAKARGWQLWRKGEAQSWIHETDAEKLSKALAMGAKQA